MKAQEPQIDFNSGNLKFNMQAFSKQLYEFQSDKYINNLPDKIVPVIIKQNIEEKRFYNSDGVKVNNVIVKRIIRFKSFVAKKKYIWALDIFGNAYAVGSPMSKSDFKKIYFLISEKNFLNVSKNQFSEWELTSSKVIGELEEISQDGLKKKICKIIKEVWCRLSCLGAPESDEPNCVKECKVVHRKVCSDEDRK